MSNETHLHEPIEVALREALARELAAREAAEAQAAAERVANAGLRAALQAFVEHWDDYDETTGLDVDDTRGIEILHAAKAALSAAPPNAMKAQPPAPASVPPAAAPQEAKSGRCNHPVDRRACSRPAGHGGEHASPAWDQTPWPRPVTAVAPQEQQGAAAHGLETEVGDAD